MQKKIILISGNMGSGKTTLGKSMSALLGYRFFEEPVEKNPYLDKFFVDPVAGCFDLQVFFIEKRIQALREVAVGPESCILDRSVFDSRDVYIPVHLKMGHINIKQYQDLLEMIDKKTSQLPSPDLLMFLNPGADQTLKNINDRNRDFEKTLDLAYFHALENQYQDFYKNYLHSPKIELKEYFDVKKVVSKLE